MNKIILVGGGTGGHCIPMAALYKKFLKLKIDCLIVTDKRGSIFFKDLKQTDVIVLKTPIKFISKLQQLINFPIIYLQILSVLLKNRSTHILGFGGYLTLPALLCAKSIKRKISIHEANAVMGKANRVLSKYASFIFLSFSETKMVDKKFNLKIYEVGLPLREEFENFKTKESNKYIISIIGGSQGSYSFSKEVPEAIIKLSKNVDRNLLVYHQCRKEDISKIKDIYRNFGILSEVSNYFNDMPKKCLSQML